MILPRREVRHAGVSGGGWSSAKKKTSSTTCRRRQTRSADELLGLCRGVLADGAVSAQEARFLLDWVQRNRDLHDDPLVAALYGRIDDAMADGVLDSTEEADLLEALHGFIGGEAEQGGVASESTRLPLDDPPPTLVFAGRSFVVTGTFKFGARRTVTEAIEQRGGSVGETVLVSTYALIVGSLASRDWLHSSYGRKVMKALEYRGKGHQLLIVGEDHWLRHL
jgi:hypothetical protein